MRRPSSAGPAPSRTSRSMDGRAAEGRGERLSCRIPRNRRRSHLIPLQSRSRRTTARIVSWLTPNSAASERRLLVAAEGADRGLLLWSQLASAGAIPRGCGPSRRDGQRGRGGIWSASRGTECGDGRRNDRRRGTDPRRFRPFITSLDGVTSVAPLLFSPAIPHPRRSNVASMTRAQHGLPEKIATL